MSRRHVEGLSDINKVLKALPQGTAKATLVRFGKKRLQPMAEVAKQNAPVAEGDLRDSIRVGTQQGTPGQRKKRFADKAAVEVYMGPDASGYPQALPQEMGSINNPPAGYMRKAWDGGAEALLDGLAEDLGAEVDRTAKRHARKLARRSS